MSTPRIHSTPAAAVADRVRERVIVDGQTFQLDRPAALDKVFDHPAVRAAYASDDYIPYWTDLWAAGRMLAKAILREPFAELEASFGTPLRALEIGCGLGLGGLAAMARGLHATFSDCDEAAVGFAAHNAALNRYTAFDMLPMDLRSPPAGHSFPVILGSDVMYEERLVDPLAELIQQYLVPGGLCLITDPDRNAARTFRWRAERAGLTVVPQFIRAGEPGGERTKGTLYRITKT